MKSMCNLKSSEMLRYLVAYRGFGVLVFVIVLGALASWALYGNHTVLSAVVRVGKHHEIGYLETNGDLERYLNNAVLPVGSALGESCDVAAVYLDVPSVKIVCRGSGKQVVVNRLSTILDAVISRHEHIYRNSERVAALKRALSESRIVSRRKWIDEVLDILKHGREGDALAKAKIFEYQDEIELISLSLQIERFQSKSDYMTSVKLAKVVTREFDVFSWLLMVVVSAFSGFVGMLIMSVGRLEADRLQAREDALLSESQQ